MSGRLQTALYVWRNVVSGATLDYTAVSDGRIGREPQRTALSAAGPLAGTWSFIIFRSAPEKANVMLVRLH